MICMLSPGAQSGEVATIRVGDEVSHRITRYMTGACLEDVNHEVYGGIYSQMLYGESFQEPALVSWEGFERYGGEWTSCGEDLCVAGDGGSKIVARDIDLGDGRVRVEMKLPSRQDGFAGLLVKVREAGPGADAFIGYEIALNPARQLLRLGRHRHNWEHISDTPCDVPLDRWIALEVSCQGPALEILLDGTRVLLYEDAEHAMAAGGVGLRTWHVDARFRNLVIDRNGQQARLDVRPRQDLGNVSGMWRPLQRGSVRGRYDLIVDEPFTGRHSQRVTFVDGQGEVGIDNQGLNRWGLGVRAGKPYEGLIWARCQKPTVVSVALESADGAHVYAEKALSLEAGSWRRLDFTLTPDRTDKSARFAVKLVRPGSVDLGYAFLQPGPWGRFKDLPVRKDVAEALIEQGLTVLRYGGCMVNIDTYRWKNMIGPRDLRPAYRGFWFPHSSNGWGILDFIDFCRAGEFLAIPAFNMGQTPQDMADFVEYVNGPVNSEWGRRRAQNGRPEPYRLRYIQLGNEEAVDETYWQRFKPMAEAIWQKDPTITVVVGDFAYDRVIRDPYDFQGAPRITTLAAHEKILDLAVRHGQEVWFDVHVWTDRPREPDGLGGIPSFIAALRQIRPEARFKVAVFELNAGNHALRRALSNAHAINELMRQGNDVPVVCSANCLQPYGQNENGWDQGLLFLDPSQVWAQPPYYVTQMFAAHYQPLCLKTTVEDPDRHLDVTATCSEDGRTVVLRVVNMASRSLEAHIEFEDYAPQNDTVRVVTLTGELDGINSPQEPRRIVPIEETRPLATNTDGRAVIYAFPANSLTILRFE